MRCVSWCVLGKIGLVQRYERKPNKYEECSLDDVHPVENERHTRTHNTAVFPHGGVVPEREVNSMFRLMENFKVTQMDLN